MIGWQGFTISPKILCKVIITYAEVHQSFMQLGSNFSFHGRVSGALGGIAFISKIPCSFLACLVRLVNLRGAATAFYCATLCCTMTLKEPEK